MGLYRPGKVHELDCGGKILQLEHPAVMGILNVTPDSFYDGGCYPTTGDQLKQVDKMIREGASIIDIGAVSTRPGSKVVEESEEKQRLQPILEVLSKYFPDIIISVDTYRSSVAKMAIEYGAGMINDVYAGRFDEKIYSIVSEASVPYIMMHMQGTPETMQVAPHYHDIEKEVAVFFSERMAKLPPAFNQIILDPGFGFGKNVEHNYHLLSGIQFLHEFGYPILVGFSRKSMINKVLHAHPSETLNGTTVLNTIALMKGVNILRVHDVKEAVEAVRLVSLLTD